VLAGGYQPRDPHRLPNILQALNGLPLSSVNGELSLPAIMAAISSGSTCHILW
jgi:hypothetical protein